MPGGGGRGGGGRGGGGVQQGLGGSQAFLALLRTQEPQHSAVERSEVRLACVRRVEEIDELVHAGDV